MEPYIVVLLVAILTLLRISFLNPKKCKHEEKIYYDASGDELSSDQSDACFCKCKDCGEVYLIPSGFQSDAHFDHFLYESEISGSQAVKKIKKE